MTDAELATIGELVPECEVTWLAKPKGQTKRRYNLILNKRMLIMLWRHSLTLSLETGTSQFCVKRHLKVLWMTRSLETLQHGAFSPPLFRENHSVSLWCVKASQGQRLKTDPMPLFAAWRQTHCPTGHHRVHTLLAGGRGIDFIPEHQLSWYLRVKPDYNKANKKAISTCIKKAYLKLFPCVRCCCMTLSAAAKPVTVKSSESP